MHQPIYVYFTRKHNRNSLYMATKIPSPPVSIGRALNFAAGRCNALCTQWLEPHGLTLPQWVVLSCLWRDGPLSISTLAELTGNGLPATSRIIDRMSDRGLVRRTSKGGDARSVVIDVTDAGRALDHLADFHQRVNDALLRGFSPDEREFALRMLYRIRENAIDQLK